MNGDTLTLLMALIGIIATFAGALGFVVRVLVKHLVRTVEALTQAVEEFRNFRATQNSQVCSMEQVHAEMTRDMAAMANNQREILELIERILRELTKSV